MNVSPTRRRPLSPNRHPLNNHDNCDTDTDPDADVSRPTLRRLTSETERQAAESSRSGSERGSLDLLRMSTMDEVEVLIHQIKPGESLAGIALLYGVELGILRKINKLWANDPIHLRKSINVPLEACRWSKARDTFYRDSEGRVVLTSKSTNDPESTPRVLEVITMPRSQLHSYPKIQSQNRLIGNGPRKLKLPASNIGPSIQNDLHTLPPPLAPHRPQNIVRLRPPVSHRPPDNMEMRPRSSAESSRSKKYD